MSAVTNPATVAACLRVGAGFSQGDRRWIAERFATLDARLAGFHADACGMSRCPEVGIPRHAACGVGRVRGGYRRVA